MDINLYKYLKKTTAEGPGQRFCLWVQGCSRHCSGCFAKETWPHKPNKIMSTIDLFRLITAQKDIEGVTFLGGEPFEQAKALAELAKMVKNEGLSVLTFTGNRYEELKNAKNKDYDELLAQTDLLIDGGFEEDKFDLSRPWVGSKNQRYIFLSGRYSLQEIMRCNNKIELHIDKNGVVFVNGMTNFKELKKYLTKNIPEKNYAC